VVALWRFMGGGWLRWVACSAILVAAYVMLGLWELRKGKIGPRSYRYAE